MLPPASFLHEREKIDQRWPAAVRFIQEQRLNEFVPGDLAELGIIMLGGMSNNVQRALHLLDMADLFGQSLGIATVGERHVEDDREEATHHRLAELDDVRSLVAERP